MEKKSSQSQIQKAVNLLKANDVVGVPTETVYGLAGSIESEIALNKIFSTKERPFFDPLIVHVSSYEQATKYILEAPVAFEVLAKSLWPGPVTFILKKNDKVKDVITSGLDTVGVRFPNHPIICEIIQKLGHPVAAPSANKFKKTSPTTAEHVQNEFEDVFVVDGGSCDIGIESTIIEIKENRVTILRPGTITPAKIKSILDSELPNDSFEIGYGESPVAPGHLKEHYRPTAPVAMVYGDAKLEIDESYLSNVEEVNLENNPVLVARNLYSQMRDTDKKSPSLICFRVPKEVKDSDDWKGILNRLTKASSFIIE